MKFASFMYNYSGNLGDQVQTLAAEQFLPTVDKKFNRDTLAHVTEAEKYLVIMNGWFSHAPKKCFPPSDSIDPVFFSFHLTDWYGDQALNYFLLPESLEYFRKHEPIGCRDRHTMEILKERGVDAFYSKCLTLTFPARSKPPSDGRVFLVDADNIPVPGYYRRNAIKVTQAVDDIYSDHLKTLMTKTMLGAYRDHARLVITTKLHCTLPCIAMGIPVIFFGDPDDYRVSILHDLDVPIHKHINNVDWDPAPVAIEEEKNRIISEISRLLAAKGITPPRQISRAL